MKVLKRNKGYSTAGDLLIALEVILVPVSLNKSNSSKTENQYTAITLHCLQLPVRLWLTMSYNVYFWKKESISSFR